MIRKLLDRFNYNRRRSSTGHDYPRDLDDAFIEIWKRVQPYTMTSIERVFALVQSVEYVTRNSVEGAIVECGVWKGGSMMAAAQKLRDLGNTARELFLFDTFEGMTQPDQVDRNVRGDTAEALMRTADPNTAWVWAKSARREVERNLKSTEYPWTKVHLIEGRVEDTVPTEAPNRIAILRLDTDWYSSTRHEMEHLFPRLSDGGVLIVDDYGHWQGARKAVDEYFDSNQTQVLLNRIDYTGRIAVKYPRI